MRKTESKAETPEFFTEMFKLLQVGGSVNPAIKPQIEQFWKAQEKLLDETETYSHHWFERRHEAARTALEAVHKAIATDSAEPAVMLEAMSEWQRHSVERMLEDAREWFETVSRFSNYVTETEADAVGQTLEEVNRVARKSMASVKS